MKKVSKIFGLFLSLALVASLVTPTKVSAEVTSKVDGDSPTAGTDTTTEGKTYNLSVHANVNTQDVISVKLSWAH